jgi:peptidoglycan hydrolase CwlO-like protein
MNEFDLNDLLSFNKQNTEVKKRFTKEQRIIHALRKEISILKRKLKEKENVR